MPLKRFLTGVVLAVCGIGMVGAAFYLNSGRPTNRTEPAIAAARMQQERVSPIEAEERSRSGQIEAESHAMETMELKQRIAELTEAVMRLEQTTRELNERVSRSKLALPTRAEKQVIKTNVLNEAKKQTELYESAVQELKEYAARAGVTLGEGVLKDLAVRTPLDDDPNFSMLRITAIQQQKIFEAAIKRKFEVGSAGWVDAP